MFRALRNLFMGFLVLLVLVMAMSAYNSPTTDPQTREAQRRDFDRDMCA
jgi:hypothetical protein